MLKQSKGNSLKARAQIILDETSNIKSSPRKKFRLNSKMIKYSIEKYVNEASRYVETYEYTSEKLQPIQRKKYQLEKEQYLIKGRLFTQSNSKIMTQSPNKKDRFNFYCKMLEPKTLKNPIFCSVSARKRKHSEDQTSRLPSLMMTFGKFS